MDIGKRPDSYTAVTRRELAALASPVRLQIVNIMERKPAWSARQIAEVMGRRPETLYYQMQLLEQSGLVVRSGTRPTRRSDETLYALRAGQIKIDQERSSAGFLEMLLRTSSSIMRLFDRQLGAALRSKKTKRKGKYRDFRLNQYALRLTKKELGELHMMLDGVQSFLDTHHANETGQRYSILVGLVGINADEITS